MDRRVLILFITIGSTIGGYLPTFVGYSSFSVVSFIAGAAGGVAGIWAFRKVDATF
jgi:hypothetical protein